MDNQIRKTIAKNLQLIKPMIDNIKSYPNDTSEITPFIKYIKNLPDIYDSIDHSSLEVLRQDFSSSKIFEKSKLGTPVKKRGIRKKNNLTINNNTNLTNINFYFYGNTEKVKEKKKFNNSSTVKKRKEPYDRINLKKTQNKILNEKKITTSKDSRKVLGVTINRHKIRQMKSKSPKNNVPNSIKNKEISDKEKIKKDQYNTLNNNVINKEIIIKKEIKDINQKVKGKVRYTVTPKKINYIYKEEEPRGELNLSEFTIISQIGKGTFGKIFSVRWKINNKIYALKKETFKDAEFCEKRKGIIKIVNGFLDKTHSNGIVKLYLSLCQKGKEGYNYYELMEKGNRDWEKEISIRRNKELYYTESELFSISRQLIGTLALMQRNHITHRDIKHQNIVIVDGIYKLCDFGELREMKGDGLVVQRIRGSELFMSPILFYGLRANLIQVKHNTYKSDVFSLGMCLLYAATMHFDGTDEIRELIDMKSIKLVLEKYLKGRYSNKFISLLYFMLETNEDLRPDFEQLEHKLDNLLIA